VSERERIAGLIRRIVFLKRSEGDKGLPAFGDFVILVGWTDLRYVRSSKEKEGTGVAFIS
jgi:hypothetical protein